MTEFDPMVPLVSIVTPSFNQAKYLEETIRSVVSQDYPNIEYIIVDGGSTDGSVDIIRRYSAQLEPNLQPSTDDNPNPSTVNLKPISWWVSEPDQGQTDAINKGFAHAHGQIFAWLNSDDTYLPGAISEAVEYMLSHTGAGMVYGDANLINEAGEIIGRFPARQTDYRRLRQGYVHIPQQSAFFLARLWRRVGPLDPTFYFAMDYDLWVRLAKIAPLQYVPKLWANFRLHNTGKSVIADDRCWPEMVRVHYREGGRWWSPLVFKAKIRPIIYSWIPLRTRLWIRQKLR